MDELIEAVEAMRKAQNAYFQAKTSDRLKRAKQREAQVDQLLQQRRDGQQALFDADRTLEDHCRELLQIAAGDGLVRMPDHELDDSELQTMAEYLEAIYGQATQ